MKRSERSAWPSVCLKLSGLLSLAVLSACGGSSGLALQSTSELRARFAPGACRGTDLKAEHLVVDWAPEDRAALEVALRRGPVPLRYLGCRLKLIPSCTVPGTMTFHGVTPKQQTLELVGRDNLNAYVVTGASNIGADLAEGGSIKVSMTLIGRYEATDTKTRIEELEGDCAGATHIVTAVDIGAFSAEREGREAYSATVETMGAADSMRATRRIDGDGRQQDCWSGAGDEPPRACSAPLRIALTDVIVPLPEVGGQWVGRFTQPDGPYSEYSMALDVRQRGRDISGESVVKVEETGEWARIGVEGRIEGQQIVFRETRILEGSDAYCIKQGRLALSPDGQRLDGVWSSHLMCPGGEVLLRRAELSESRGGP